MYSIQSADIRIFEKSIVLKYLILIYGFIIISNISFGQKDSYWQQKADFNIDVNLNDSLKTLDGIVRFTYQNNAPDTLTFIWIHLWPNAYKNDRTAFSDQLLENRNTSFYFSDEEKRGYINQINFKVNDIAASIIDNPIHQDIVKLILPTPLLPHSSVKIETPFHVKLPYNYSRGGYIGKSFQITQWYPKPAVYDKSGWHEMPYLDQGEFYSEFGDYEVNITLQKDFKIASTGIFQNELISGNYKTVKYKQPNIHDFAWFADKDFIIEHDSIQLNASNIDVYAYHYFSKSDNWKKGLMFIKNAIKTKSNWVGAYPYHIVSVVESPREGNGGMEYPTITLIDKTDDSKELDAVIYHEVGHNWFYGILGTNERRYPWMDEGINSYYDNRYKKLCYSSDSINIKSGSSLLNNKVPENFEDLLTTSIEALKKDQAINTSSENFNMLNYDLIAYNKTAMWMQLMENKLGQPLLDSIMQTYFQQWKFKHPYPEDFKSIAEEVSHQDLSEQFALLSAKGNLEKQEKKKIRIAAFFNLKNTNQYHYISFLPIAGYNNYDKFMAGGVIHNYSLPTTKLQFLMAPLYSFETKKAAGIGNISYTFYPGSNGQRLVISLNGASFSNNVFVDTTGKRNYLSFNKIAPGIKFVFPNKNANSSITKYIQWKTFFINETNLNFFRDTTLQVDIITYPVSKRYLNQLQFVIENNRVLYPYKGSFISEQGNGFLKFGFTGNYYFNYVKKGGLNVRLFAGKFIYTGAKTYKTAYETDRYHLNMSGANGYEDYTYNNYFAGRNEFEGLSSQQLMIKDGAFKVRSELLSSKIGKTDDWLTAVNFTTTIPDRINPLTVLPIKLPLKIFLDIGTYADAWKTNPSTEKFLYDAGLQLSLLKNTVNIYFPILYSKSFSDYFKSTITEKRFLKTISFSIDIQNISLKTFIPQIPL